MLARLHRQIEVSGDAILDGLLRELAAYPAPDGLRQRKSAGESEYAGVVVPMRLTVDGGVLSFFSTTTVFGTPLDITLSELALEAFFPADIATAEALRSSAAPG